MSFRNSCRFSVCSYEFLQLYVPHQFPASLFETSFIGSLTASSTLSTKTNTYQSKRLVYVLLDSHWLKDWFVSERSLIIVPLLAGKKQNGKGSTFVQSSSYAHFQFEHKKVELEHWKPGWGVKIAASRKAHYWEIKILTYMKLVTLTSTGERNNSGRWKHQISVERWVDINLSQINKWDRQMPNFYHVFNIIFIWNFLKIMLHLVGNLAIDVL